MIAIDKRSRVPYYTQIVEQVMLYVQLGLYKPHSRLPSIREIALQTELNFNTVKKAMAELETRGVVYTVPGKGCFVSEDAFENEQFLQKARDELTAAARSARARGLSLADAQAILESIYTQKEDAK